MPISIGTISSPRRDLNAGFFTSNQQFHTSLCPSEKFQLAVDFPLGDVAHVFDPFHVLELENSSATGPSASRITLSFSSAVSASCKFCAGWKSFPFSARQPTVRRG